MADSKESSHIPAWDGTARAWRRYTREVAWFVQSTPVHKRRYCASRLLSRLSGSARLLAMSWPRTAFDSQDGVKLFLQRLAGSPLVRQNLPNAAATCQQYFAFRRHEREPIGSFLVRETLVHEEFVEALIRLHEDKLGVAQEDRDFGLPPVQEEHEESWRWWGDTMWDELDPDDAPPEDEPQPEGSDPARRDGPPAATTGSSPSHRAEAGSQAGERSPVESPPERPKAIDELSMADSFILEVLRGWRLMQASGLTADERRDILASTKNSMDYAVIASALQNLWDDQMIGRSHHGMGAHQAYMLDGNEVWDTETAYYQEQDDDWWQSDDSWWNDAYYTDESSYGEDPWWMEDWWGYDAHTAQEPDDAALKEKLQEAQQAEQVAESLAAEAHRTWAEAQRATQALRKDRGFGAVMQKGSGKCFNCGGSHFARDCPHPDRRGLGYGKGKGKAFAMESDDGWLYYTGKGKGKPKGKGKKGPWMQAHAIWTKGKGKTKGKSKERTVNAYASDIFLGGLEFSGLEMATSQQTSGPLATSQEPHLGMIDSGATASAAPEAVVKGLISAILTQDKGAKIEFDQSARPYFRFGNGRWGRALCRVHLSSTVSGQLRSFSLYTLPNPDEYFKSGFDKSSLVPVLVGMDCLGRDGIGIMIDFASGLAMNTKEPNPAIYPLTVNKKGHYTLDILHHLTQGHTSAEGQAHVVIRSSDAQVIVDHIRAKTKPKAKAQPLDPSRRVPADLRDPRALQSQWPCHNNHVPGRPQANAHGQWTHCAVCNLRMEYVPRLGSHGQTTKADNPGMTRRMLDQLQVLMGNCKPTAAICLAMQRKIDAEEQLNTLIRERMAENQMVETVNQATPATTSASTPGARVAPTSPQPSSPDSWEVTSDMNPNTLDNGY
ncbi:unnamed protein product [Symbiodinium sp. CCMP2592]|nr:unnamed protein product [Symbiodinium sp. CCMP2592]